MSRALARGLEPAIRAQASEQLGSVDEKKAYSCEDAALGKAVQAFAITLSSFDETVKTLNRPK